MLFWDRLVPNSAVYNVPFALAIEGPLDRTALAKSLDLIVSRHETLRSRFLFDRGEPVLHIDPESEGALSFVDLSDLPASEKEFALQQAANAEARRPFHLATGSMLHCTLIRSSAAEHLLVLTMHHIAADGWSVGVLLQELSESYLAFTSGTPCPLPPLTVQYTDFARWQRDLLHHPDHHRGLSFWAQQLDDAVGNSELLPLDRPRPAQQTFPGATLRATLPTSTLTDLAHTGQLRRATAFMVMLAALQSLFHSYSSDQEILIGVPIANRVRSDFEPLIGCFMNMVVVRGDLSGNPTFLDFLGRIRETAVSAFLNSEVPFPEIVRHIRPKRFLNRNPWFQVQLVFQSYPMPEIHWPELTVRRFDVDTATSKFDLTVLVEIKNGLELAFEYNTDLFDRSTMQSLLEEYVCLLRHVIKHPDSRLRDLSVASLAC